MSKLIVSEMRWSQADLDALPIEKGFRMRGLETTRLDTLIDAAFAFVLSMLVISQGEIPSNASELIEGIKNIPALAMSFWVLMLFWLSHRQWSRRFAIESKLTILLSTTLVFSLIVYVYPLRILLELMFHGISGGYFPRSFNIITENDLRFFFVFYAVGYLVMSLLMVGLQYSALSSSKYLQLNALEHLITKSECLRWLCSVGVALLSIAISFFAPIQYVPLAGYIFFLIPLVQFSEKIIIRRLQKQLN